MVDMDIEILQRGMGMADIPADTAGIKGLSQAIS
jgi:hypothetical protein